MNFHKLLLLLQLAYYQKFLRFDGIEKRFLWHYQRFNYVSFDKKKTEIVARSCSVKCCPEKN